MIHLDFHGVQTSAFESGRNNWIREQLFNRSNS